MEDMEQYEGLPPELIAALVSGSFSEEELADIAAKIQSAESMRDQAFGGGGPQGRQAGSVFVAANPLEHVGNFMQGYGAMKRGEKYTAEQGKLREAERGRIQQTIDALRPKPKAPALPGQEDDPSAVYSL